MPVILLDDQMRAPVDGDGSMAVNEGSVGDPRVKLTCPMVWSPETVWTSGGNECLPDEMGTQHPAIKLALEREVISLDLGFSQPHS